MEKGDERGHKMENDFMIISFNNTTKLGVVCKRKTALTDSKINKSIKKMKCCHGGFVVVNM